MIGKAVIRITLVAALSILATFSSYAQSTKVKGRVTDSETGEGIPFCSVYFKNTTIGISTDMRGYYSLETRDTTSSILSASMTLHGRMTVPHTASMDQPSSVIRNVLSALMCG